MAPAGIMRPQRKKWFGAPVEILKREGDVVLLRALFQNALGLRDDFGADTVAGDHRDREGLHGSNTIVAEVLR